ncbi:MAG TPA: hypothetical protein VLD37_01465 [Candidatus Bilamarchaeum sp.]|nr:hypothetical protein [Candidatus Bilamarchaeum sp.]
MKSKVLLLALLAFGMCFAGLSVNGFTVSRDIFQPGDPGVATVSVSNPTGAERVTAITMSVNAPPEILVTSAPTLADISAGGSAIVSIPFKVKADAKPGIYIINVEFRGFVSADTAGSSQTSVNTASIPITIVNEPILSISSDAQVLSGSTDVALKITNNGGVAKNVRISINPDVASTILNASSVSTGPSGTKFPVAMFGQNEIFISSVTDVVYANVTLDSRSASDGPVDIPFVIAYEDELGNKKVETTPMRMTVRNAKLNLNFNQKTEMFTRKDSTLTLELVNNGNTNLKDVRLKFLNSSLRLKTEEELKFGDIPAGGTASVTAVVFTDAPPGVNSVDSLLTYIEKDVQKEETRKVPLTVTSDADVAVYLEAKPLPLTLGSDHTISVLVSNLGSYRIENVDVSIESPVLRSVDISDRQYIGGLSNDDFSTVQFQMQVNATGEGTYPAIITVNYRDQSGEWKQKTISQEISVYSPPAQEGSAVPLIAGVVILAAGIWWFKFRKK